MDETTTTAAQDWTAEDVETLARKFMGWRKGSECYPDATAPLEWYFNAVGHGWHHVASVTQAWNPFTDARDEYMVLERAREVWRPLVSALSWEMFREEVRRDLRGDQFNYTPGMWARAVLAVLRSTEEKP